MGSGASTHVDDETLLGFIKKDLERAERMPGQ